MNIARHEMSTSQVWLSGCGDDAPCSAPMYFKRSLNTAPAITLLLLCPNILPLFSHQPRNPENYSRIKPYPSCGAITVVYTYLCFANNSRIALPPLDRPQLLVNATTHSISVYVNRKHVLLLHVWNTQYVCCVCASIIA